jgi:Tol biopolymer transport system component
MTSVSSALLGLFAAIALVGTAKALISPQLPPRPTALLVGATAIEGEGGGTTRKTNIPATGRAVESLPRAEIFVVKADGSGRRNLTRSPAWDDFPALAPDGRRLAFIREPGDLWTMDADGARARRLRDASGWGGLRWSPEGRRIAFSYSNSSTPYVHDVGLFEPDGMGLHWITDASDPTWAPDGKRLAFRTDFGGFREGPYTIAVANDDGSARRGVVRASDFKASSVLSPFWSPRRSLIAFSLYNGSGFPLYVVDVDEPSTARMVATLGYNPAWSRDGGRVAFTNPRGIWVVRADGSGLRLVVSSRKFSSARNPAWSPDGKRIAFVTGGGNNRRGSLLVVDVTRGRPRILARRDLGRIPIWSRDGRKLYYVGFTGPRPQ